MSISYLVEGVESGLGGNESWFRLGQFDGADLLFLADILGDDGDFLLFLVGERLLFRDLLLLGADHGDQLVGVFILDRKLFLLSGKFPLEVVDLTEQTRTNHTIPSTAVSKATPHSSFTVAGGPNMHCIPSVCLSVCLSVLYE